jgi:signal transduction histidine kinase
MESKKIVGFFRKKLLWQTNKSFLAHYKNLLTQAPDLLDRGLAKTCSEQMKELIELCEERKKGRDDKGLCWIYGMACCLYEQAYSRFGRKNKTQYLEKATEIAQKNDFTDILFWINKSRLDYACIFGKSSQVQEIQELVFSSLKKLKQPESLEVFCLPVLAWDALNRGDFQLAQEWASKSLDLARELGNINLQVWGNVLLGKIAFGLKRIEEALPYFEEAISLGQAKKVEQLVPALYNMAEILLQQDKISEAKGYLQQAQQRLKTQLELPDSYYHIHLERLQGLIVQKEGQLKKAEEYFSQGIKRAQVQGNLLEEGLTQLKLGSLYMELNDSKKATVALEEASAKFIIIDNQFQLSFANEARRLLKEAQNKPATQQLRQGPSFPAHQQIEMLDEFMKLIVSNLNLDSVLKNVIEYIMKVTDADRGFLILLDEAGKLYSQVFRAKEKFSQKKNALFKKFSQTISEEVLRSQKSICLTDAQGDARFANSESVLDLDIRSVICTPLKKEQKKTIGLIYIDRHSLIHAFTAEDLALVESLADYASIALVNARLHSKVQKELKTTEAQLIQSEKMATVGVLAGGVAHEINTPLGAILLNTEMLLKQMETKSYKKMLRQIEESTQHCKQIIEMLLQYSRKSGTNIEKLDLNQVIDKSCTFLEQQLLQDNIRLSKEQEKLSPVEGNFNELMQVFTNLIVNAKEAIKSIKQSGSIVIKSYQEGNFAVAQIKDDGMGIPQDHIKKIFDPFFTTKEVGKGTGLGLSIVYRIVENHQGSVEVSSRPQEGSAFTIKIPVAS